MAKKDTVHPAECILQDHIHLALIHQLARTHPRQDNGPLDSTPHHRVPTHRPDPTQLLHHLLDLDIHQLQVTLLYVLIEC